MPIQKSDEKTSNTYKTQKNIETATRTGPKTGDELKWSEMVNNFCSACDIIRVTLKQYECVISVIIWNSWKFNIFLNSSSLETVMTFIFVILSILTIMFRFHTLFLFFETILHTVYVTHLFVIQLWFVVWDFIFSFK